jgi:hypothetical protein
MAVESTLGARSPSRSGPALVLVTAVLWILANLAVVVLADGYLPFDRPALAHAPFAMQVAAPSLTLVEVFLLMAVVQVLTRRRPMPDLAARAPGRSRSAVEALALLAWAMAGQAGGWIVGPAFGGRPFSFHIAGVLVGCSTPPAPTELFVWAGYDVLVFALAPYLWFRRRYSNRELSLGSTNWANDALVIVVICVLESLFELSAFPGIFRLSPRQALEGGAIALAIFFVGTVLPTMILIYAILLPRYLKITGSPTAAALLGALTYAAMHLVEGWSLYDTPRHAALSLLMILLGYFGPGLFKSYLTLRTGNAWVHALGYHAVAPHVVVDASLMAKAFAIR